MTGKLGLYYQGFSHCDTRLEVEEAFKRTYGREPEEAFRSGPVWLAGPLTAEEIEIRKQESDT